VTLTSMFIQSGWIFYTVRWRLTESHCSFCCSTPVLLHSAWLTFDISWMRPRGELRTCWIWTNRMHFNIVSTVKQRRCVDYCGWCGTRVTRLDGVMKYFLYKCYRKVQFIWRNFLYDDGMKEEASMFNVYLRSVLYV
jgi:hypothetical protein